MRSLADLSGKRANRARGAVSHAERAEIEQRGKPPKREIPVELDPATFDARVKLEPDDEHDAVLQRARRAFGTYRERLKNWHEREAAIWANEYELDTKKRMLVSEMIDSEFTKGLEAPNAAIRDIGAAISTIDKEISNSFRARLKSDEAREIRQHVKAMTKSERAKFLRQADDEVISAVLGAKGFLSGLADAEADLLRHQAVNRLFPEQMRRRAKLEKAGEMLEAATNLRFTAAKAMIDPNLKRFKEQAAAMQAAAAGGAE